MSQTVVIFTPTDIERCIKNLEGALLKVRDQRLSPELESGEFDEEIQTHLELALEILSN